MNLGYYKQGDRFIYYLETEHEVYMRINKWDKEQRINERGKNMRREHVCGRTNDLKLM